MEISSVSLWSSNLLKATLQFDEQFLNNLQNFIFTLRDSDTENIRVSNIGGWHSNYSLASYSNVENKTVHQKVNEIVTWLYTRKDKTFFERNNLIMNSWANINENASYQTYHNHAEWALSAVFYVSVPENLSQESSGSINFQDFSSRAVNPNFDELKHIFGERERKIKVNASDLLIFPSHIPHSVNPTYVDEPRVTIAFNFRAIPITQNTSI
jgi:uncharacterized protein (TIGR02466 family)